MPVRSITLLSLVLLIGCDGTDATNIGETGTRELGGGAGVANNDPSTNSPVAAGGTTATARGSAGDTNLVATGGQVAAETHSVGVGGNQSAADTGPLRAPSDLTIVKSDSGKRLLTWQDRSNGELGFEIEYRFGREASFAQAATVGANVTSWEPPELSAGEHYYRVRAFGAEEKSEYSAIYGLLVLAPSTDPRTPITPNISTLVSPPSITFSWKGVDFHESDGGCPSESDCGYRIYARRSLETNFSVITIGKTATSVTVDYLPVQTDYYISAFNRFGDSGRTYIATIG